MNRTSLIRAALLPLALAVAATGLVGCAGHRAGGSRPMQFQRGMEAFEKAKYGRAAESFKTFIQDNPSDDRLAQAQYLLGESYLRQGDYQLAEVEFSILMSDYAYSAFIDDALLGKARAFWKQSPRPERDQEKSEEALRLVEQYLIVYPESSLADEAVELKNAILDKLARKAYLNARTYQKIGDLRAARIYFGKAIEIGPDTEWALLSLFERARISERFGETARAAEDYRTLLERFPKSAQARAARRRLGGLDETSP